MQRKQWLLLGLAAADGKPLTPVHLQKLMFLFQKAAPGAMAEGYHFEPYHYGPFDATVYRDAEELENGGFVAIDRSGGLRTYSITPAGMATAQELSRAAPNSLAVYLKSLVQWMMPLSFAELVRSVYKQYPDQRQNSVFQG